MTTYLLDHLDLTMVATDADVEVRSISRESVQDELLAADFVAYDTPRVQALLRELASKGTTHYTRDPQLHPGDRAFVGTLHDTLDTKWRYVLVRKAR
jgi:hypothetical protein